MIQQIGKHKVKHGSITLGIDDLMQGQTVDLIYTDPPWGQGTINFWQTLNNKNTNAPKEVLEYNYFMETLFSVYRKYAKDLLFVEYGCKWKLDILEKATRYGFSHIKTIPLLYKSGKDLLPMDLHIFAKNPATTLPKGYVESVTNSYGYKTLQLALKPFAKPGMTILDPMCGMGYTAQIAVDNGMTFFGNELNSTRLQKTIARLKKD